jgi:aspartate carbamoyltransferase catalytic subunit
MPRPGVVLVEPASAPPPSECDPSWSIPGLSWVPGLCGGWPTRSSNATRAPATSSCSASPRADTRLPCASPRPSSASRGSPRSRLARHHALPRRPEPAAGAGARVHLHPPSGVDDQVVVLVDDVLFSGAPSAPLSTPSATSAGRAPCSSRSWSTAGTVELPIRPDFVGKNLPTSLEEQVHVALAETDGVDEVTHHGGDRGRCRMRHLSPPATSSRDGVASSSTPRQMADGHRPLRQEAPDPARAHGHQPLLRGLHAHAHLLRDGREATVRRHHQLRRPRDPATSKGESPADTAHHDRARWASTPSSSGTAPRGHLTTWRTQWIGASVINAGDGTHEHPTQALLDAYTLRAICGAVSATRRVATSSIVGDLLHSGCSAPTSSLLARLGADVTVVAPPTLMPSGIGDGPREPGSRPLTSTRPCLPRRRRPPRRDDDAARPGERMSGGVLPDRARVHRGPTGSPGSDGPPVCRTRRPAVLHPGPMNRGLEISRGGRRRDRARHPRPGGAGVSVRMAVLYHLLADRRDGGSGMSETISCSRARTCTGGKGADIVVRDGVIVEVHRAAASRRAATQGRSTAPA